MTCNLHPKESASRFPYERERHALQVGSTIKLLRKFERQARDTDEGLARHGHQFWRGRARHVQSLTLTARITTAFASRAWCPTTGLRGIPFSSADASEPLDGASVTRPLLRARRRRCAGEWVSPYRQPRRTENASSVEDVSRDSRTGRSGRARTLSDIRNSAMCRHLA
jgi:hypothetical protein